MEVILRINFLLVFIIDISFDSPTPHSIVIIVIIIMFKSKGYNNGSNGKGRMKRTEGRGNGASSLSNHPRIFTNNNANKENGQKKLSLTSSEPDEFIIDDLALDLPSLSPSQLLTFFSLFLLSSVPSS